MTGFGDGSQRTPFEEELTQFLHSSVDGVVAPAALASSIRARLEAPDAVGLLATVNAVSAPAGLRARVAAAVTALAALVPGRPIWQHPGFLASAVVSVAAAATIAVVTLDESGDDAAPGTLAPIESVVGVPGPGDDGPVTGSTTAVTSSTSSTSPSTPPSVTASTAPSVVPPFVPTDPGDQSGAGDPSSSDEPPDDDDDTGTLPPVTTRPPGVFPPVITAPPTVVTPPGAPPMTPSSSPRPPLRPTTSTTEPPPSTTEPPPSTTVPDTTTTEPPPSTTVPDTTPTTVPDTTTTTTVPDTTTTTVPDTTTTTTTTVPDTTTTTTTVPDTTTTTTTTVPDTTTTTTLPPLPDLTAPVVPAGASTASCSVAGDGRFECQVVISVVPVPTADGYGIAVPSIGLDASATSTCGEARCVVRITVVARLPVCDLYVYARRGDEIGPLSRALHLWVGNPQVDPCVAPA